MPVQQEKENAAYTPIQDYGVIGNLHTTALVSINGSIDFMCYPRFDSPTVFASILDAGKGGAFSIAPADGNFRTKQLYLPGTNILLTRFLCEKGISEMTDFMPVTDCDEGFALYRKIRCISGEQTYRVACAARFDYARGEAEVSKDHQVYKLISPTDTQPGLLLESGGELGKENDGVGGTISLKAGEECIFFMRHPGNELTLEDYLPEFKKCHAYWTGWIKGTDYDGPWKEAVLRSALAMKLLTSAQFGSTVAAATFGLPEVIGGERNWDYRYTWIRDSAFTMYAFLRLGFTEEADHFMEWIKDVACEKLQLLYGVDGNNELPETELNHLEGYRQSTPVRIGNGAYDQVQMDIFGELIDTIYLYERNGGSVTYEFWQIIVKLVEFVIDNWQNEGHGIWEVRSGKKRFLHSNLCCWVAIDRAMRIAEDRSLPADLNHWRDVRDKIYKEIYEDFYDDELQAYVQYKGGKVVDASALLMPLLRFVSSEEPRWLSTLDAIEKELIVDVLVFRYKQEEGGDSHDGLEGEESTFTICSFWYVECLARCGRMDEAELAFEKLLGYANHLGLYSEEISLTGDQLGNFPQAFSHLSLISAAFQIGKKEEAAKN